MDNTLFEEKYSLYSNLIFKLSMTYLANKSDAEDVTQEVFIKLFTNKTPFDTLEHEKYWIIRVTINACKNHLRTFWNKNTTYLEDNLEEVEKNTEDDYSYIQELLFSLNEKYRVVLYLYYYEGYSIEEIAKILKITQSGVKMRLKRGREKLKLDLEAEDYEKKRIYSYDR